MRFEFEVEGDLPPKKDGASSMWGKEAEVPRLIGLRRSALQCLGGAPPLASNIALVLEIHLPSSQLLRAGDLDNFVTGVCDGLQAVRPRARLDPRWGEPGNAEIHPARPIAIQDDSAVLSIQASKVALDIRQPRYRIVLSGDP